MCKNHAKLIVVSDSYGNKEVLDQIRQAHPDADCFIHCGDSELMPEAMVGFITVQGNSDPAGLYPNSQTITIGKHRIMVRHCQDMIGRFYSPVELAQYASDRKCDVLLFGHLHEFCDEIVNGVHLINPGAITRPANGAASYAEVNITKDNVDVVRHWC